MAKSIMHLLNMFSIATFNCIAEGTGNIDFYSLELQGGASSCGICWFINSNQFDMAMDQ